MNLVAVGKCCRRFSSSTSSTSIVSRLRDSRYSSFTTGGDMRSTVTTWVMFALLKAILFLSDNTLFEIACPVSLAISVFSFLVSPPHQTAAWRIKDLSQPTLRYKCYVREYGSSPFLPDPAACTSVADWKYIVIVKKVPEEWTGRLAAVLIGRQMRRLT